MISENLAEALFTSLLAGFMAGAFLLGFIWGMRA